MNEAEIFLLIGFLVGMLLFGLVVVENEKATAIKICGGLGLVSTLYFGIGCFDYFVFHRNEMTWNDLLYLKEASGDSILRPYVTDVALSYGLGTSLIFSITYVLLFKRDKNK